MIGILQSYPYGESTNNYHSCLRFLWIWFRNFELLKSSKAWLSYSIEWMKIVKQSVSQISCKLYIFIFEFEV